MNNIDGAHEESKESPSNTIELLASLFEEPKESKIKRVKAKPRSKSVEKKSAATRLTKDVQQRTPTNRRERQVQLSGSEVKARATKKKTQVRKPAVPGSITVKDPRTKAPVQETRHKTIAEKRSVPAIRKHKDERTSKSSLVKKNEPAVSEVCVRPPEASSHPQRRSIFGSTTLGIGLPFAIGVLLTFLGTRYAPLDFFDGDRGIALAENEMVENPAPKTQDATIPTVSAATVDTAKQENESETPELPPIGPEKETIGGSTPKESNTPVSGTPQETIVTAKQKVSSTNPELSMSTQYSGEAARTETFQWDASKSYPYSAYFGSYSHIDRAQEAISSFQEKGLSPYWVRVDLGEKGVWYRVLAGYFRTKDEVKAFIEKHQITEGRSRYVLYANLIGLYSSDEELKEKNLSLLELGCSPYVIKGDDGESLLLTGAFYHKADAEKERIELASKGIQTQLVKR